MTTILDTIQRTGSRSTSELYDRCTAAEWQEFTTFFHYHDLIKTGIEIYIKFELEAQRNDLWQYAIQKAEHQAPDIEQFEALHLIFEKNHVDPKKFAKSLKSVLRKEKNKVNCLRIVGCPNSGKTLISNCITKPFICCYNNNHGSENEFYMENFLNKSIILCEELYITIATAEDFKSVLGGQPIDIAKKFNKKQLLSRTPVIITSNYERFGRGHLSQTDENALAIRCENYNFNREVSPDCEICWQQFYLYISTFI